MNIVVVDYKQLAAEADFPPVDTEKFGWEQYPGLSSEELADKCWRANIIVTIGLPVTREQLQKMSKLTMIAIAGQNKELVDLDAAREQNIAVSYVPDTDPADAELICKEVVDNINAFIRNQERNRLT